MFFLSVEDKLNNLSLFLITLYYEERHSSKKFREGQQND